MRVVNGWNYPCFWERCFDPFLKPIAALTTQNHNLRLKGFQGYARMQLVALLEHWIWVFVTLRCAPSHIQERNFANGYRKAVGPVRAQEATLHAFLL
jgi:hypothetical protein